jgi:hypothetical protein
MNDTDSRATPLRRAQTMRWLRHIAPSVKLLYTSLMRSTPRPPVHRMEASCPSELLEGSPNGTCQQVPTISSPVFQGALDVTAKTAIGI